MRRRLWLGILAGMLMAMVCGLSACKTVDGPEDSAQTVSQQNEEPVICRITFYVGDEVVELDKAVHEKMSPEEVTFSRAYADICWIDEIGLMCDPFAQAVRSDAVYYGYPTLHKEGPFLSMDENGFLNIHGTVRAEQLKSVVHYLIADPAFRSAVDLLVEQEMGEEDILTYGGLTAVLTPCLPKLPDVLEMAQDIADEEAIATQAEGSSSEDEENAVDPTVISEETPVTTRMFVKIMMRLLDRSHQVVTGIEDRTLLPRDLDLKSSDASMWIMASIPCETAQKEETAENTSSANEEETAAESDTADAEDTFEGSFAAEALTEMEELLLSIKWEEGPHVLDGHLYYADEDGNLLRNEGRGILYFGDDGRYTTANEELDEILSGLIEKFSEENPTADRLELLQIAFDYIRDLITYTHSEMFYGYPNDGIYTNHVALRGLTTEIGNCYEYGCAFALLARNLGYNAHVMNGKVLEAQQPHCWVQIMFDGSNFFFDPQLAMREVTGVRDNYGQTMFMLPVRMAPSWLYWWYPIKEVDVTGPIGFDPKEMNTAQETENSSADQNSSQNSSNNSQNSSNNSQNSSANSQNSSNNNQNNSSQTNESSQTALNMTPEEVVALAKTMLGNPVTDLTAVIGEPTSKEYSSSCMGPGQDGMWTYDGFIIYTYKEGNRETIRFASVSH